MPQLYLAYPPLGLCQRYH